MPHADVGDLRLYYELHGGGPRVLFISGTGADLRVGPTVFEGPLGKAATVLAYDQRGLGRSDKPDRPYTMAEYADDAAALLDHVGWDRPAVVGVSFGGMVAQELALRHPRAIDRLVLCCTSAGGTGGASYPLHELEALDADTRARRMLGVSDTRLDAAWQAEHPEDTERLVAMTAARGAEFAAEPGRAEGARRQLQARAGHDTWDRLPGLTAPTLVCAGRYDGIAPPDNASALAERIPGAELRWFEGGHLFLLQDRTAWPAIVDWLLR